MTNEITTITTPCNYKLVILTSLFAFCWNYSFIKINTNYYCELVRLSPFLKGHKCNIGQANCTSACFENVSYSLSHSYKMCMQSIAEIQFLAIIILP